jgi:hypothetical protein
VLGPLLAQAVGMHGVRGAALTVAATLLLVVAGAVAREWLLPMPAGHEFTGVDVQASAFFARNVWMMTMAGLLFAAYCTARERDAEATRAAREAELARARDERAMLESRLAIMHAHVEPQALFDALGDIVATCRDRPDEAYVRLDRLIDHLRAALPRLREGAEPSSAATPGPVACRRT